MKTFGALTREQKLSPMTAWLDGRKVECFSETFNSWMETSNPSWVFGLPYRIKPTTKDYINWDHVNPEYMFMARCENGNTYLFTNPPNLFDCRGYWGAAGGHVQSAKTFSSYKQGNVDWEDSLVCRGDK